MDTAHSLEARLADLRFTDLSNDQATARIIEEIADWGSSLGWRVYRRAPSVFPLPPPLKGHSVLDVACARPSAAPIAIEVDRLDRPRTVEKLLAEAAAGREAIWVRWGAGPFTPPPLPVHMVTRPAVRKSGTWSTEAVLPPPRHSDAPIESAAPASLPGLGADE
ncbi:hypothetical protein ACGFJ7_36355 [Actinoplanes sp. NPDC048988]|uniref:hypothetical protein n=1 Tax=Actinoplanes sp. NPDC048988 TaxID=3363901 RepID=UPI0037133039